MIIINIITRTSKRPLYFKQNYDSIKNQILNDKIKINHIVSYDNKETYEYLKEYSDLIKVEVEYMPKTKINTFSFNLYFNILHDYIEEGYIMYLDDDDYLAENDSIMKIIDSLSEDAILIWRVSNGKQIYPSNKNFNTKGISYCDFTSNCFMYNSKWLKINKQLVWPGVKGGDYRFGLKLYKTIKKINLLDEIICKIDNINGFGLQKDKIS